MLPSTQIKLFNASVVHILHYCSEIWGLCKADPIETFYLAFLKSILRVKRSTPNCFVYGELGIYPLSAERKIRVIKYWVKIVSGDMNSNPLILTIYRELLESCKF